MAEKKHIHGTTIIGGKTIPLTKNGLPNGVYLTKEAKEIVKNLNKEAKEQKKSLTEEQLKDLYSKLGLLK